MVRGLLMAVGVIFLIVALVSSHLEHLRDAPVLGLIIMNNNLFILVGLFLVLMGLLGNIVFSALLAIIFTAFLVVIQWL